MTNQGIHIWVEFSNNPASFQQSNSAPNVHPVFFFNFQFSKLSSPRQLKSIIHCNHFRLMKLLGLIISDLFNSHTTMLVKFIKTEKVRCNSNSLLTVTPGDLLLCKIFHYTLYEAHCKVESLCYFHGDNQSLYLYKEAIQMHLKPVTSDGFCPHLFPVKKVMYNI